MWSTEVDFLFQNNLFLINQFQVFLSFLKSSSESLNLNFFEWLIVALEWMTHNLNDSELVHLRMQFVFQKFWTKII